jgi:hypothetical protein
MNPRSCFYYARKEISVRRLALLQALVLFAALLPGSAVAQSATPASAVTNSPVQNPTESSASNTLDGLAALDLARQSVTKYFEQAANVVCAESVTQGVVNPNGKINYHEDSAFEYQLLVDTNTGSLRLSESRETRKAPFRDPARTLLITNGFTSMLLIVHADYQDSFTFEPVGEEVVDGAAAFKISFKPVPGGSSPAALQLRGKNYPLPLSGSLWIDARTGSITKLVAEVDSSLSDLGLKGLRSEIHYATIKFHDPDESYWMPVSATIDVETPRQHWRNLHRFSNYRRFRASIQVVTEGKP